MTYQDIIDKYYPEGTEMRHILMTHSRMVTMLALEIVVYHPELNLDAQFVLEAAMLHDIGICQCDAPSIDCHGEAPYIQHGRKGAEMLRQIGWDRHARVCERHTGAGISRQQIIERQLPMPLQDYFPETMEEKVVCYADKFYSKTHLERRKTLAEAEKSISKYGLDGLQRFREWQKIFALPNVK